MFFVLMLHHFLRFIEELGFAVHFGQPDRRGDESFGSKEANVNP